MLYEKWTTEAKGQFTKMCEKLNIKGSDANDVRKKLQESGKANVMGGTLVAIEKGDAVVAIQMS